MGIVTYPCRVGKNITREKRWLATPGGFRMRSELLNEERSSVTGALPLRRRPASSLFGSVYTARVNPRRPSNLVLKYMLRLLRVGVDSATSTTKKSRTKKEEKEVKNVRENINSERMRKAIHHVAYDSTINDLKR
ncbi:hypothetical protein HZH68_011894 [Vespula germanica]|uniref:Uncharacterized protein n=2 Tax=Vespula TaxID=7451 RepID=A0A834JL25_VESGE|nr:hypothetical protein HZH68_011894 [Vespula germanica]KAF7413004.1 hypothetical protein H0235_012855 [Vespula pensylvanica]